MNFNGNYFLNIIIRNQWFGDFFNCHNNADLANTLHEPRPGSSSMTEASQINS